MTRSILSIVAGYAIFVISSIALFQLSGQKPHAEASINFQLFTAVYGAVFAFLGGLCVQWIAKTEKLNLNYILAVIMAGFAAFSMAKSDGSHWTQVFAILIFAPISILGGVLYKKFTIIYGTSSKKRTA